MDGPEELTSCNICSEIYFGKGSGNPISNQTLQNVHIRRKLNENVPGEDKPYVAFLNNPKAHCQPAFKDGGLCWSNVEKGITDINENNDNPTQKALYDLFDDEHISVIDTLNASKTYAVVMMRRGYELCDDESEKGKELTSFAYIIPHDELSKACDVIHYMSGEEKSTLVLWIISIISTIILIMLITGLFSEYRNVQPEMERCALDIKISGGMSSFTSGSQASEINCPTQEKEFSKRMNDEEIKDELAQSMVSCYELWGSGDLLLFDEDGIYCHMCQLSTFEEDGPAITDFGDYLTQNPTVGPTYANQLTAVVKDPNDDQDETLQEITQQLTSQKLNKFY